MPADMTMPFEPQRLAPETASRLKDGTAAIADWLVETRRSFHRSPELGWREIETTQRIVSELSALGYEVIAGKDMLGKAPRLGLSASPVPGEGDTGCIARFDTGRPGPTVCLRVDIDALPIREANTGHRPAGEDWRSAAEGVMHACGHDGHITIGLGVARLLRPMLETANGRLLILFQPAEEGGRGARAVADAGWMEEVDLFLAIHVGLGVPSGTVAVGVEDFLATRKFRAILTGRSAHAGKAPEEGRSALLAACQAVLGLHALAQSARPNVRVHVGVLHAGESANIVPDRAVLDFEIRASDNETLDALDRRCRTMIASTAEAHEVASLVELRGEAGAWSNPPEVAAWAAEINSRVAAFPQAVSGFSFGASEDATILAAAVADRGGQAGILVLGADLADGHHTPHFDFDEDVLARGVLLMSALIADAIGVTA